MGNKQIVVYGSNAYARQPFRKKIEKDDGTESEIEFDNINVEIFWCKSNTLLRLLNMFYWITFRGMISFRMKENYETNSYALIIAQSIWWMCRF